MNWLLLKNSLLAGGLTTLLAVTFGFVAALWMSGLESRWRNWLIAAAIMALALPPFLATNCWLHYLGVAGVWRGSPLYSVPHMPSSGASKKRGTIIYTVCSTADTTHAQSIIL